LNKMKNKCSIYIISHKADALVDKFDQTYSLKRKIISLALKPQYKYL
jgi:ABC-type Mn2+/Zn2+ transport system ATPase subunit